MDKERNACYGRGAPFAFQGWASVMDKARNACYGRGAPFAF